MSQTANTPAASDWSQWQLAFVPLDASWLERVMAIEQASYSHPWTRQNFADSFTAEGYACTGLAATPPAASVAPAVSAAGTASATTAKLLGYSIALCGYEEVHLLNITTAPDCRGMGLSVLLLEQLCAWARAAHKDWLWLEVRRSNIRAQQIYTRFGLRVVGERKNYYPTAAGHEDALLMSLQLHPQ